MPPAAVAFDVHETLFGVDPVGDAMEDAGLPGHTLDLWLSRTLGDGFALAAVGENPDFHELAHYNLRRLLRSYALDAGEGTVAGILSMMELLDAYEDVAPALHRLKAAGVRVVTLTNGRATVTKSLLERAGLLALVERCFDADEAGAWKPRPEAYRHVAAELGLDPGAVALVSTHSWDVHGAVRAGLVAAWVSRLEGEAVPPMANADVVAPTLTQAVETLLKLEL